MEPAKPIAVKPPKLGMKPRLAKWWNELPKRFKKHWMIYLMLVPFFTHMYFFSFRPIPFMRVAWMRFSPFLGMDSPMVGWENFHNLLFGRASDMFLRALQNTLILSLYGWIFIFPIPIIIAIMYHETKLSKFRTISQSVLLLPNFFSAVVITGIAIAFMQPTTGIINQMLLRFGLIDAPISFLIQAEYSRFILLFLGAWGGVGSGSLIYLGSLMSIDKELYESASLDGAGRLKRIWHISLPGLKPLVSVMFILRVAGILGSDSETIMLIMRTLTQQSIDTLGSYVLRIGLLAEGTSNLSVASAAGIMTSFVGGAMMLLANFITKKMKGNHLF